MQCASLCVWKHSLTVRPDLLMVHFVLSAPLGTQSQIPRSLGKIIVYESKEKAVQYRQRKNQAQVQELKSRFRTSLNQLYIVFLVFFFFLTSYLLLTFLDYNFNLISCDTRRSEIHISMIELSLEAWTSPLHN